MQNIPCALCKKKFPVFDEDEEFYKKINVPAPKLCPEHRRLRRLMFRNDRKLYKRSCGLCKKSIIATYDTDAPHTVYCPECWWSDKWDGQTYGQNFDFNKPFFEQWNILNRKVPHISLWQIQNQNSEYSHDASHNKDCYMIFAADYNRDSYYSWTCIKNNDCCDCAAVLQCERCYECHDCIKCQFCTYTAYANESSNCHFCFDLINCHDCFGSSGLREKKYYWLNEPLSKEEWEKRFNALQWTHDEIEQNIKKAYEASLKIPRRYVRQRNSEDSTGHAVDFCKNVKDSHDCNASRDCRYCLLVYQTKDLYDVDIAYYNVELCYESHTLIKNCFRCFFTYFCRDAKEYWYSTECYMSSNLFGCVGLRNKKYRILNKEYSKEEYEKMIHQIQKHMEQTGEWGEFFHPFMTPFAYNETAAFDYLDRLTEDEAAKIGLRWKKENPQEYKKTNYVIPDRIADTPDSIVEKVLACEVCGKNYRIIPQEFRFYKFLKIPIPKKCFECRHLARLQRRGPRKLFNRNCQKCDAAVKTIYSEERQEIIYCEKCYLASLY